MKIYITHCSATKKKTNKKLTPDKLYIGVKIQRFINRCKATGVKWAIFSDKYGVWFANRKLAWYEKHPNKVTLSEFDFLIKTSVERLRKFSKVYFYGNHKSRYFHPFYEKLIRELRKRKINVIKISHLERIA